MKVSLNIKMVINKINNTILSVINIQLNKIKFNRIPAIWKKAQNKKVTFEYYDFHHAIKQIPSFNYRFQKKNDIYKNDGNSKKTILMMTGDIMCQKTIQTKYRKKDGSFDFDPCFSIVKKTLEKADFVIGNLETCICENAPYDCEQSKNCGHIYHNAPLEFLSTLKKAGFDALVASNNHMYDAGIKGIYDTYNNINNANMIPVGIYAPQERKSRIVNVNGIKIGLLAYSSYWNKLEHDRINQYGKRKISSHFSEKRITKDIKNLRKRNVDFIITYIHAGKEYTIDISEKQKMIIQKIADTGSDYIVCAHPHVIQKYDLLKCKDGRTVPVYYSLGNFISDQNQEYTEYGAIAYLELSKRNGTTSIEDEGYIPVVNFKSMNDVNNLVFPIIEPYNNDKESDVIYTSNNVIENRMGCLIKAISKLPDSALLEKEGY